MKNISVIIPFLNEAENLPNLVHSLNSFFTKEHLPFVEVIFIDDGSTDHSLQILKGLQHETYKAKVISFSKNYGSHAALRAGILNASENFITFIYADLQDPLSLIPNMYNKCLEGNEIVWAHRESTESRWVDRLFSRWYATLMKKFAVPSFPEKGFDVVMFSRKVAEALNQNIESNSSIFLQILTLGFKQAQVSYQKNERTIGKSKWTVAKKIKLLIDSFVAFSYFPIRLVSLTGILIFIVGLVWASYLIVRKLIFDDLESGWPALFSTLLLGFGLTNISLGIIAEYLWRTLDVSRKRPVFIINEIIELSK